MNKGIAMLNKLAFNKDVEGYGRFEKFSSSDVYYKYSDDQFDRIEVWSTGIIRTLSQLIMTITEPIFILYVLHVGRKQESARYQSMELKRVDTLNFLDRFGDYIQNDSRHDIWLHSPQDNVTIVYDRDNLIYLYGAEEKFEQLLNSLNFSEQFESIYLPTQHRHYYHAEFDQKETEIISSFPWRVSPLQDED
ncbi:hypothetical protein [Cohnella sp. GCM10012308]|uniref:hypothetical protein n=1 Tax=Cohnella sp. GCM10012308 TaxID=3317329 RepID=UPI0036182841